MALNYATLLIVLAVVTGIVWIASKSKPMRMKFGWITIALLVVGVFALVSPTTLPFLQNELSFGGKTLAVGDSGTGASGSGGSSDNSGVNTYEPSGSYTVKDKWANTFVTGTSYYKVNSGSASTTTASKLKAGDTVTYWVDNLTNANYYWVKPLTKTALSGVNYFEGVAYLNGSNTISTYDVVNSQATTAGVYNTSMGANKQANVRITFQPSAKKSAVPFGGVLVVEFNSTISSVTCTGDGILSSNPYHLTYTTATTQNTFRTWGIGSDFDDGTGTVKVINCQFQNGAQGLEAGAPYYIRVIPANWYPTNDGRFVLDTEKYDNQDTTRTGSVINRPSLTNYFST